MVPALKGRKRVSESTTIMFSKARRETFQNEITVSLPEMEPSESTLTEETYVW